jgi:dTDP-4-amino-4,6-dideoxygalactose transaminase
VKKKRLDDLAVLGGEPLVPEALHVGRPNIADRGRFLARVKEMFDRRWLTNNGPFVHELEQGLEALLGVKHCIAMCNATVGLEVAAHALGLRGEVILPSFTFVASAHALTWLGITPVFCDVDPRTHNIDPGLVEALITPRTTGILGVHVWGRACEVDQLSALARQHGLKLLFDAAHALGSSNQDRMIGGFGDAEVFSFHATKFFNTFEGGAVTTNSDELAARLRRMRNFGFAGLDNVEDLGTNAKMSEISAAMGLGSLERLGQFIEVNHRNYGLYRQLLDGLPGISLVQYDESQRNNYQYVVLEVDSAQAGLDRDTLIAILHAEKILARRYFYPGCHEMEPYRTRFPEAGARLPVTQALTQRVLQLPTGTAVTEGTVSQIGDLIHFVLEQAPEIRQRMDKRAAAAPGSA